MFRNEEFLSSMNRWNITEQECSNSRKNIRVNGDYNMQNVFSISFVVIPINSARCVQCIFCFFSDINVNINCKGILLYIFVKCFLKSQI